MNKTKDSPPSFMHVHLIYRAALKHVGSSGQNNDVNNKQSHLRRVSVEFHRRLKLAGIHVEGAT